MAVQLYKLVSNQWQGVGGRNLNPPSGWPYGALGSYKPNASTSGIPTGTTLTTYPTTGGPAGNIVSGDLTITAPVTLDSYDFHCRIKVNASNVHIKRSRIRGNTALSTNSGCVDATNASCSNLLIEDCLLQPDTPSIWVDGIIGHDYTLQRCDLPYAVDATGVYNTHNSGGPVNVSIQGCYMHDSAYFSPDSNHSGDSPVSHTHNDTGCQVQGGSNISFIGNNVQGFANSTAGPDILLDAAHANGAGGYNIHYPNLQSSSCIQVTVGVANVSNFTIDSNWFDGGAYSINFGPASTYTGITITNNKFGTNQRPDSPGFISVPASASATISNNTRESDGTAVPVQRY